MSMFRKRTKKTEGESTDTTLEQQFRTAKSDDAQLIAFFEKLYLSSELKPYWQSIYTAMNDIHAEENLDFFVDYLDLVKSPSQVKWKALFTNWISIDVSKGFLTGGQALNITGKLKDLLTRLDSRMAAQPEQKAFDLDTILLEEKDDEEVYTAKNLIDMAAVEALRLVSNDSDNVISLILAKSSKELTGGDKKKKKDKEKKKELGKQ